MEITFTVGAPVPEEGAQYELAEEEVFTEDNHLPLCKVSSTP